MLCKRPFMRNPNGDITPAHLVNYEARAALTPFGCGQCMPCRINKARVWKHRILLENKVSCASCFTTLTYDEENIPKTGTLVPRHLQLFLKRLRKRLEPQKIRYFAVGEYGTQTWRPHYHAMLFGCGMEDQALIDDAWGKGFTMVGDVTNESADYITGYVIKNMNNDNCAGLNGREPEFMRSSRGSKKLGTGGIGLGAIEKIAKALKNSGFYDGKPLKELKHGKKDLPLGRYLGQKMGERAGTDKKKEYEAFWNYQQEQFAKHGVGHYINNVVDEKKQERLQQKKKYKIYRKRKKI